VLAVFVDGQNKQQEAAAHPNLRVSAIEKGLPRTTFDEDPF